MTGSGTPAGDPALVHNLDRIAEHGLDAMSLPGDNLHRFWVGNNASSDTLMCPS